MKNILTLGIDIGTTTLSAVVLNITKGEQLKSFTLEHKSAMTAPLSFERIQDADKILFLAQKLAEEAFELYPDILAVGLTGQMHGILYIDENADACSPLYTWQDGRGEEVADEIKRLTGMTVFSGYGLATHYYNLKNSLVPASAKSFCSIMDYIAMKLADRRIPLCHPSVAASFGLFDNSKNDFDGGALEKLGINKCFLPRVIKDDLPLGKYKNAYVTPALGDNQASVFGSVADEESSVLVNYGTGSQVSVITDRRSAKEPLELRPYIGGKNIICGCALCGGYAYELLEGFFKSYAEALGIEGNQYAVMDALAEEEYSKHRKNTVTVNPLFKGTRQQPDIRGDISGLSSDNFSAGRVILGTIEGMARELYEMYRLSDIGGKKTLVVSGNGVRKNRVLQRVLEDKFNMKLLLLKNNEEAASGAAMYSALSAGASLSDVKKLIRYHE
ncbi:MAG: hypothetical protein E7591_06200 [Ruminococcaceae bacterium]|nr:hypothetical protein [Oscillospiraceae bacterium]